MTSFETTSPATGIGPLRSTGLRLPYWLKASAGAVRRLADRRRAPRIEDLPDWLQRDLGHEPENKPRYMVTDIAVSLLFGTTK